LISDSSESAARGLTVANGGNVGILTASPSVPLDINGSIAVRGCAGNAADMTVVYTAGYMACPAGTYATWMTGVLARYQNQSGPTSMTLNGQMFCCPCPGGSCPNL